MWPFTRHHHTWALEAVSFGVGNSDEPFGTRQHGRWYQFRCSVCHAAKREFLPGLPLPLDADVVAEAERIVRELK